MGGDIYPSIRGELGSVPLMLGSGLPTRKPIPAETGCIPGMPSNEGWVPLMPDETGCMLLCPVRRVIYLYNKQGRVRISYSWWDLSGYLKLRFLLDALGMGIQ